MERLSNRTVPARSRNYSFFPSGTGGFSFGIFSQAGAIQPKEAAIDDKGHHFLSSKSQFNFIQKEFCHEK